MDDANKRIADKIAKLLAIANDGRGNKNEAETALRQAEALMRKHGIEEADVMLAGIKADGLETAEELADIGRTKTLPIWVDLLCCGVARFTDTVMDSTLRSTSNYDYRRMVRFRGEKSDVVVACWLLKYLMEAITRERKRDGVGAGAVEGHSYRRAAASVLQTRMYDLRADRDKVFAEAVVKGSTGTALTVVSMKIQKVEEEFGKMETETIKVPQPNPIAAILGAAAGSRINLHQQLAHDDDKPKQLT